MKRRIILWVMVLVLFASSFSAFAVSEADPGVITGRLTDSIMWILTPADENNIHTLVIRGNGGTPDWDSSSYFGVYAETDKRLPFVCLTKDNFRFAEGTKVDIIIEEGITYLGECLLWNFENIRNLHLPESLKQIADVGFSGAETIYYPGSMIDWQMIRDKGIDCYNYNKKGIVFGIPDVTTVSGTYPNSNVTYFYDATTRHLVLDGDGRMGDAPSPDERAFPNKVKTVSFGPDITHIGDYAFYDCDFLECYQYPFVGDSFFGDSVTSIGKYAFSSVENLTEVYLDEKTTEFGEGVFADTGIRKVEMPQGVTKIPDKMFYNCPFGLTNVAFTINDGVTYIGNSAFEGTRLQYITVPESVTYIGDRAFAKNYVLQGVKLPEKIEHFGDYVFESCRVLYKKSVNLPYGITKLVGTFDNCDYAPNVTIPETVTEIGEYAFARCKAAHLIIPETVMIIGDRAFEGAYVKQLVIPDSIKEIGEYAFSGFNTNNIIFPEEFNGVISKNAFGSVSVGDNTLFVLPQGITKIPVNMLWYSGIRGVVIPSSVTWIEAFAFSNTYNLNDVYFIGTKEQWDNIYIDYEGGNEGLQNAEIHFNYTYPDGMFYSTTPAKWAAEDINFAKDLGVFPAIINGKFDKPITRAEFCAVLVKLVEKLTNSEIKERAEFRDTKDLNVYKAAGLGIVNGIGEGEFGANETLTREQAATMLIRLANVLGEKLPDSGALTFADGESVSDYAREAVDIISKISVMGGVGDNMFAPKDWYTREQSVVTAMRMYRFLTTK